MTIDSAMSSGTDAALDFSGRLASGVAHELGGLLFALRLRLETLAMSLPAGSPDVAALEHGFHEIQATVDAIRLLGSRAGTGRLVRERAVTAGAWLARFGRLARYAVPRGVAISVAEPAAERDLGSVDLRRLTAAGLLAVAHLAEATGVRTVSLELASPRAGAEGSLVLRLGADGTGHPTAGGLRRPTPLTRARRLLQPIGGRIRARGPAPTRIIELVVELPAGTV